MEKGKSKKEKKWIWKRICRRCSDYGSGVRCHVLGNKRAGTFCLPEAPGDLLNRDTEQKIESLASYIQSNYYEDVDTETLEEGLYAGLFDNLDVYSQYYTAEEAKELFDTSVSGTYCGIGASLQQDDDSKAVTILHVYDGSPAQESGLQEGRCDHLSRFL